MVCRNSSHTIGHSRPDHIENRFLACCTVVHIPYLNVKSGIDAELDLTGATSIVAENTVNMNGNRLRLNSSTHITLNYDALHSDLVLFSNVGELLITLKDGSELALAPGADVTPYLTLYSNDTPLQGASITYSASGDISIAVPEPSGTSLSLLVLVSLATRRRRKH